MRVIVVGAGVIGLACAWELQRAGASVTVLSADDPGTVQSAGLTRVFRLSHGEQHLIDAARSALDGWHAWESQFEAQLLQPFGLLVTGSDSDLAQEHVSTRVHGRRHPLSNHDGEWWFESSGAVGLIGVAIDALAQRLTVSEGTVVEVKAGGVVLADGRQMHADRVVVCAGANSRSLAGAAPTAHKAYARFSFPISGPSSEIPCWIQRDPTLSPPFYAVADGPEHFAIGLSEAMPATLAEREHLELHRPVIVSIAQRLFPRVVPEPVRPLRCVFPTARSVVEGDFHHDGWDLDRHHGVLYVSGPNLYKFAPHLGRLVTEELLGNP